MKLIIIKLIFYSSALLTNAVIFKIVFSGLVLAETVTVLVCLLPACPLEGLKTTSIFPLSPGKIGSFGQLGTVHPQDPLALDIFKGSFPELVKLKEYLFSELNLSSKMDCYPNNLDRDLIYLDRDPI